MNKESLIAAIAVFMCVIGMHMLKDMPFLKNKETKKWAVYYTNTLPFSAFKTYDILAFDSDHFPDFHQDRRRDQVILGYLSTTEAESYRNYYSTIEKMDILMHSPYLPENRQVIDIRKPEWREYFTHTLIPQVLAKGFDGIMLDTIDTVLYLEENYPLEFSGMKNAAVQFISEMRQAHPKTLFMLNRGFPILDAVAPDIDYFLAESICSQYDAISKSGRYFPQTQYNKLASAIHTAQRKNPRLEVVTLDYWDMSDKNNDDIRTIYARQRANHFIPYVTTADLFTRHPEP